MQMTTEQIDLEFAHIAIDKKLVDKANGKQVYEDDEYDDYDNETEERDSRLSDMPVFGSEVDPHHMPTAINRRQEGNEKEDDWEDVETDDFED